MATNNQVNYKLNFETKKAESDITALKVKIKKLEESMIDSDKRTREYKNSVAQLSTAKANLKLKIEEQTQAQNISNNAESEAAIVSDNSILAIQRKINILRQEMSVMDMSSKEFKVRAANMRQLTASMQQGSSATGIHAASAMELGRVFSDAPYGIRGVANNISQLASLMAQGARVTDAATGKMIGFSGAIKGLWKSLMGPLGILLAFQAAIAALEYFSTSTKEADESVDTLGENIGELVQTLDNLYIAQENVNLKVDEYIALAREKSKVDSITKKNIEEINELEEERDKIQEKQSEIQVRVNNATEEYNGIIDKSSEKAIKYKEAIQESQDEIDRFSEDLEENKVKIRSLYTSSAKALDNYNKKKKEANAFDKDTVAALQEEKKELEKKQKTLSKTSEAWKKYAADIKDVQDKIEAITGKKTKGAKKTAKKTEQIFKDSVLNMEDFVRKQQEKSAKIGEKDVMKRLEIDQKYERLSLAAKRTDFKTKEKLRFEQWTEKQAKRLGLSVEEFKQEESYLIELAELKQSFDNADTQYNAAKASLDITQKLETNEKKIKLEEEHQERLAKAKDKDNIVTGEASVDNAKGDFKKIDAERELLDIKEQQELSHIERLIDIRKKEGKAYEDLEVNKNTVKTKYTQANIKLDDSERKARLTTLSAVSDGIQSLGKLAGDNASAQKAIGVATATIDTYIGANKAFAVGGPAGFISGAAIIASGLANVMTIINTKIPNEKGGTGIGAGGTSFTPNFNVVGNSQTNQLADSIGGQVNEPSRAYVVYEDIQNATELNANAVESVGI